MAHEAKIDEKTASMAEWIGHHGWNAKDAQPSEWVAIRAIREEFPEYFENFDKRTEVGDSMRRAARAHVEQVHPASWSWAGALRDLVEARPGSDVSWPDRTDSHRNPWRRAAISAGLARQPALALGAAPMRPESYA